MLMDKSMSMSIDHCPLLGIGLAADVTLSPHRPQEPPLHKGSRLKKWAEMCPAVDGNRLMPHLPQDMLERKCLEDPPVVFPKGLGEYRYFRHSLLSCESQLAHDSTGQPINVIKLCQ